MSDDQNRQIFREEAYELLTELEGALLELDEAPDNMDLVNRIFRALHTIKGSGAMFDFDVIAEFTHQVENAFDLVRTGELKPTKDLLNLALKARDHIKNMLDSEGGEAAFAGAQAALLEDLKIVTSGGSLAAGNEAPAAKGSSRPEPVVDPLVEPVAEENVFEPMDSDIESPSGPLEIPADMRVEPEPFNESCVCYRLKIIHRGTDEPDESRLSTVFEELERIGRFEILARPQKTGSEEPYWEAQLMTDVGEDRIHDIFFFAEAEVGLELSTWAPDLVTRDEDDECECDEAPKLGEILVRQGDVTPDDVREALSRQKPLGQILAEAGKIAPDKLDQAVRTQAEAREAQKAQEASSSLRVAAEKLDYLVDLVGEMVIVQAQITQLAAERADQELTPLAEELERLSDELRDTTLGVRMLPIGTTFSKFRRLVRDLSDELGKKIALATEGAETELDKTVIERLSDPLVHLLRNSIDHGIESPEVREAAGKNGEGVIILSAEHSGGEVLIRITDDGRGMDPAAIRQKGVERGLIAPDAELTDSELFKLIFEPGFSTASKVTSVSGRGVGMDVVKRAIDSLRGSINIASSPGAGTTIIIRLPLTLAIIDGLQVRVENEFYVIPLPLVEECVELNQADLDQDSRQRILYLRGEIVPYVHLRDWFEIGGESPPIEQVVITGVEGNRVGIVVDTVIGEHQTVIKSLSRVYKDVEGISGATIKGDGSIALILDIPGLIRRVVADSE